MPKNSPQPSFKYQVHQTLTPRLAPLSAAVGGVLTAGTLQAATITVTTLQDGNVPGECSLRSAIYASNSNAVVDSCIAGDPGEDEIVFDDALNGTINLVPGTGSIFDGTTLRITETLEINGDFRVTVQGAGDAPVIYSEYNGGSNEQLTISRLTITGGGGANGGGILSTSSGLAIRSSTITGNSVTDAGGGIFQQNQGTGFVYFAIRSSEISNNSATGSTGVGGGIYTTDYLQLLGSDLLNNEATVHGGAIARYGSSAINLRDNEFTGNVAVTGSGGALYSYNDVGRGASFFSQENAFRNNIAGADGGAISINDISQGVNQPNLTGRISVRGTRFETNQAAGRGGALFITKADRLGPADSQANLVQVVANPYSGTGSVFQGNTATDSGGGLYFALGENTTTTISDTNFIGNISESDNGGGAFIDTSNGGVNLSRAVFAGNRANISGSGGGLYAAIGDGGDFQGSTTTSYANYARFGGGGIALNLAGGELRFRDSYFGSNLSELGSGGGMQITGSPSLIDIERMAFIDNSANNYGGGLDLVNTGSAINSGIKYSEFSNNTVAGRGGAAYLGVTSNSNFFFANSTVSGNTADLGGGLYASGDMNFNLKYSTLVGNEGISEGGGLLTDLSNACEVGVSLFDTNTGGALSTGQDIRRLGTSSVTCSVQKSLLAGTDSEFSNDGGNLLGQPSLVEPLADNGGTGGRTHALPLTSPAVDAAGAAGGAAPGQDQRGPSFVREFGAGLDMGAFEYSVITDGLFSDRFETP